MTSWTRAGHSRSGTNPTSTASGPVTSPTTCACTTPRSPRSRRAHPTIPVAGPATAAVGWLDAFLEHVAASGSDLDLLTPHAYGIPPLDVRAALRRHGREDVGVWWTEWGPTPTHFHPVNDHPWVATFTARGMLAAARTGCRGRVLGGERPLRGARPPAAPGPRRLRPAQRGQPGQASVLGAVGARAAGRRGGRRTPRRRRRRLAGAGLGVRRRRAGGGRGLERDPAAARLGAVP